MLDILSRTVGNNAVIVVLDSSSSDSGPRVYSDTDAEASRELYCFLGTKTGYRPETIKGPLQRFFAHDWP